jgi:predicted nucleotidyltransferase
VCASEETVRLGYVFGSQVEGHTGPLSDVDIGVLVDSSCRDDPTACRARLAHEIGAALDTDAVDLVLLNQAPIELAYRVIAQGKRVYEESRAIRVEYEAYVLGRYGDYLPVLRKQREQILTDSETDDRIQRYRAALRRTERTLESLASSSGEKPDGV